MNPAYFERPAIQATAATLASEVMDELERHPLAVFIDAEAATTIQAAVQQLADELLSDHLEQARRPAPEAQPINAEAISHLAAFQAAILRSCGESCHAS